MLTFILSIWLGLGRCFERRLGLLSTWAFWQQSAMAALATGSLAKPGDCEQGGKSYASGTFRAASILRASR